MKRLLTGAILIALVITLIALDLPWLVASASGVLALLAALEYRSLAAKAGSTIPLWWLVLAVALAFLNTETAWVEPLALFSLLTLALFTASALGSPLARVLGETGAGLLLLVYIVYPLTLLARILAVEDGTALLLFLFLCVWCGDIAALYIGKRFGRRKLAPSLSPNKTWEGSLASLAGSLLFGLALVFLGDWSNAHNGALTRLHTSWPWWQFALLAVLLNAAAQMGDLAESALKRAVDVKDSGTLLPGHGGILDRIDALLFAAPVLWIVLLLRAGS